MTDFNEICYHAVTEFLILKNIQSFSHSKYTTVWLLFTVNMRNHMPLSIAGQLSFIETEEALKMSSSQYVPANKTVMLLKVLFC